MAENAPCGTRRIGRVQNTNILPPAAGGFHPRGRILQLRGRPGPLWRLFPCVFSDFWENVHALFGSCSRFDHKFVK
ncbi:MAG TPA: hypothetical protein H9706_09420 [Candidatus Gemmiger stercorigallinarum]|nr:hypothetical protein [Candidatus Gemmiger stercorigallinarum]